MPPVKVEGGGEQLDWGESLTKTKEETAQQKKWGTYIYILSFFLGGGCLGKLSLFIFQTLEVPSCEVFRAWLLGCDIFFFFVISLMIFEGSWTDLAKIPPLEVQRQEDPSAEATDCTESHTRKHCETMWNRLKLCETEPIYDTWHDISEFMFYSWCVWADCPHLP